MSEPVEPIADMAGALLALMAEQYKQPRNDGQSPRLAGIVAALADEGQMLEAAWQEMLPLLDADSCSGVQLDVLGRIANTPRNGATDAFYRAQLAAAFRAHYSGTPENIMDVVKAYTKSTKVWYYPEYPAGFWIVCDGRGLTVELLERLAPAGVQAFPFCYLSDAADSLIRTANGEPIFVVGPCEAAPSNYLILDGGTSRGPTVDLVVDGGVGAAAPDVYYDYAGGP